MLLDSMMITRWPSNLSSHTSTYLSLIVIPFYVIFSVVVLVFILTVCPEESTTVSVLILVVPSGVYKVLFSNVWLSPSKSSDIILDISSIESLTILYSCSSLLSGSTMSITAY